MKTVKQKDAMQLSWMVIISSITQVIAIFKSTVTAANFGACTELDAYHFANNLSTFFLTFISAGITTVIIPAYIKKKDRKAVDTFISVIFSIVGLILLVMYLGRGVLVDILSDRESTFKTYTCNVLLLTILIQFLPAILGVTTAYYQTEGKYNIPKIILMISNLGVAIILLSLKNFTIYEYLWILMGGTIFQFIIDIAIAIKCGFRFRLQFDIHNKDYKELTKVFLPTIFSSGIYKVNTMIDSLLSSNLGVGQLTMLSYSNTMVGMVNNMFIGNLSTYAYPKIVKAVNKSNEEGQKVLWLFGTIFHAVLCLIISGFVVVGREFIAILYEHGKFSSEAADVVYFCMCIYVFGQQNNIVRDLIYRFFYSNGNTKETTKNSFMSSVVNAVSSIILAQFIGIYGLVIGTVFAGAWSLFSILLKMKKNYGFAVPIKPIAKEFIKNYFAMICSGILPLVFKFTIPKLNPFLSFLIFGFLTVAVFVVILLVTKSNLLRFLKKGGNYDGV